MGQDSECSLSGPRPKSNVMSGRAKPRIQRAKCRFQQHLQEQMSPRVNGSNRRERHRNWD